VYRDPGRRPIRPTSATALEIQSSGGATINPPVALATFDCPRAIECAREVTVGVNTTGLEIRAGIPSGKLGSISSSVATCQAVVLAVRIFD